MHYLVAILAVILGPLREPRTVRIASLGEVAPIRLDQIGKLVIFRLPGISLERIERSEDVLDFRGMHGAEQLRIESIGFVLGRGVTNAAENVFVNRLPAGLALHLDP